MKYNTLSSVLVIVLLFYCNVESRRSSGGSRISHSYSRPSPSYSRPSYSSPSYSRPSQSYSHPSPSSLSYPSWHPAPASRPSQSAPSHPSSPNQRPIGFENVKPLGSSNTHGGAVGPPTHSSGSSAPNYGFKPSVTHGTEHATNAKPVGSAPPNYGFNTAGSHGTGSNPPPIGFKPSVTHGTSASAPPAEHATNTKPLGNANSGNPPPYGFKPSAPVGPPVNSKPVGNVPPGAPYQVHPPPYTPYNPGVPPPAYNPAHNNPAGYGAPPAYNPAGYGHAPAYNPAGYGSAPAYYPGGYSPSYPSHHYYGSSPGVTNININNINTNTHHSGYYGGGYGSSWGYHYPSYSYSNHDTGSGVLGFFLGYSLAKITTPTYHTHSSFYDGYTPRYDHYEVHHYYHNRDSVPAQSTIQPNTITGCIWDSGTICPIGTTSLCTSNGAILCVASATSTVPCTNQTQGNCVRTTIPCVEGSKDCQVGQNKSVTIPCISKATVPGNITYVNNTIIVYNTTIINNNNTNSTGGNGTVVASLNSSVVSTSSSVVQNSSIPLANLTVDALSSLPTTTMLPLNITEEVRIKRDTPAVPVNDFCVTILALPAERKPTEQEKILKRGTDIFSKFLVKALGVP